MQAGLRSKCLGIFRCAPHPFASPIYSLCFGLTTKGCWRITARVGNGGTGGVLSRRPRKLGTVLGDLAREREQWRLTNS